MTLLRPPPFNTSAALEVERAEHLENVCPLGRMRRREHAGSIAPLVHFVRVPNVFRDEMQRDHPGILLRFSSCARIQPMMFLLCSSLQIKPYCPPSPHRRSDQPDDCREEILTPRPQALSQ